MGDKNGGKKPDEKPPNPADEDENGKGKGKDGPWTAGLGVRR